MHILDFDLVEICEVVIRSILSLVTLFFVTKMLGKKQVSQLSLFDYVIGISIGNFAAEISLNTDTNYINGVVAVIVFGIIALFVSIITMKSIVLRRFIIGTPTIIIQNGKIIEKNLKKVKLDINDLLEECRNEGYFDISKIKLCIMEANGKLSIMLYSIYDTPTLNDMKLKGSNSGICANIVIDGKYMINNITNMKKSLKWVKSSIKTMGYKDVDKILLATLDQNDKIVVYEKNVQDEVLDVLE